MKTPDTTKAASSVPEQASSLPFSLPHRTDTACAEVLARLLKGEVLTGMDAVYAASTTRLAAHVHYLADNYRVETVTGERAVGCRDGRVVTITTYELPPAVVEAARAGAAARWIATVRSDRAAKRAQAALAHRKAANINATRKRTAPPWHQPELFINGGSV
ncbi:MAG: hypothetical protein Q7V16_05280 [Hydrogenophaga sp.]|nr:hypothetical protein [Hydrogenophaga sp.]MDP1782670.1 hypothetical protein [Hydrogenophaga sp.]